MKILSFSRGQIQDRIKGFIHAYICINTFHVCRYTFPPSVFIFRKEKTLSGSCALEGQFRSILQGSVSLVFLLFHIDFFLNIGFIVIYCP